MVQFVLHQEEDHLIIRTPGGRKKKLCTGREPSPDTIDGKSMSKDVYCLTSVKDSCLHSECEDGYCDVRVTM